MKIRVPRPTTVDFETFGIEGRPAYPPVPVSVSVKEPGKKTVFVHWGHVGHEAPAGKEKARRLLERAYANPDGVLMHHAKFDLEVAWDHFGLPVPPWDRVHDTSLLVFLDDPNQREVALKPAAHRVLGWAPDERDAVRDWLLERQPVPGVKIGPSDKSKEPWGKYIAYAPPEVVGPYADGDVDRTAALFERLYPSVLARGMGDAYDRERRVSQILLAMERRGIRVDVPRLERDVAVFRSGIDAADAWIRTRLGQDGDFNVGSGDQLVEALDAAGLLDRSKATLTPTGKVSTAKGALDDVVSDPQLASVVRYRNAMSTCVGTFLGKWLEYGRDRDGLIFTNWNQIKGEDGGTRTGRLSSSNPFNFQNMPNEFPLLFCEWALADAEDDADRKAARLLPRLPKALKGLPRLPACRGYIVPYSPGHALVGRDASQQEIRILAHFEDGPLMDRYRDDPWTDMHDGVRVELEGRFARPFKRKPVKNINLGLIYGQGVSSLAGRNAWTVSDTQKVFDFVLSLYPGLDELRKDMKRRAAAGVAARTWGGREFLCEPPAIVKGRFMNFAYKMPNTLIQGSAADHTKQAMINFFDQALGAEAWKDRFVEKVLAMEWVLLMQVHDELVLSVPVGDVAAAHSALRAAMEGVEFDVPMLSEGAWSVSDWGSMEDYDVRGKVVAKGLPPQSGLASSVMRPSVKHRKAKLSKESE